jgi:hypothetical protein
MGIWLDYSSIEVKDELSRANPNQHAIERRKMRERKEKKNGKATWVVDVFMIRTVRNRN